jgi:hypothetical protein
MNEWFWQFSQVDAGADGFGPMGQVKLGNSPGSVWTFDSKKLINLSTADLITLRMEPAFQFNQWSTIICQAQAIGIGPLAMTAGNFLITAFEFGWKPTGPTGPPGTVDGIWFGKDAGSNKLWTYVTDTAAGVHHFDTGITLAKGETYKMAIRIDTTNSKAWFYVNDKLVDYTDAATLMFWPAVNVPQSWEADIYPGAADGYSKGILVKPPWIVMGR